jgi:hypothetical protein
VELADESATGSVFLCEETVAGVIRRVQNALLPV